MSLKIKHMVKFKWSLTVLVFMLVSNCYSQAGIDLKSLIGKPQDKAEETLTNWTVYVSKSKKVDDLLVGYREGLQIEIRDGKVATIRVELTDRRTGAYPFQVDKVLKAKVTLKEAIKAYGEPSDTGDGTTVAGVELGSWVKWKAKTYQMVCEIIDGVVVMVIIIEP